MWLRWLLAVSACGTGMAQDYETMYRGFRDPPPEYSPMPYWFWNGEIEAGELRRQIELMQSQGVHQAIVFPWDGMKPSYFGEGFWRVLGEALDIARERGFTLNLADEHLWPSGHVWTPGEPDPELSLVLRLRPEFRMRRLAETEETVRGPADWVRVSDEIVAVATRADSGEARVVDQALAEGEWRVFRYRAVPAVAGHNTRVDLLNPEAVDLYLQLYYEELARRFPEHLGRTLRWTLADHEGGYGVPIAWTPRLFEEFRRRKGYSLETVLPRLTRPGDGKPRRDYYEVISALYAEAFTERVAAWCRAHGLKHGTSLYEEQFFIQAREGGDMFRHWRAGSLVFVDALLERARMPLDFKEASSVAHFERIPLVVENQGLQGHDSYLSPDKMRTVSQMALMWGANRLVPYFDYDPKRIQWPPQWFFGQPFFRYFRLYSDVVRRAQYMNEQGIHVAPIAIYYPLETVFSDPEGNPRHTQNYYTALQLELTRHGWDFHVLDAHYLERAEIRNRQLHLGDEEFRVLILPPMTVMDPAAKAKVHAFERSGGVVIRLDGVKEHPPFMDGLDYRKRLRVPVEIREALKPVLGRLRETVPPIADVPHTTRRSARLEWYFFANDEETPRFVDLRIGGILERWDLETGNRMPIGSHFSIPPHEAWVIVRRPGPDSPPPFVPRERLMVELPRQGWTFTPEAEFIEQPYLNGVWLRPERLSNRRWWISGAFPFDDHRGFFTPYGPESGFDPSRGWTWTESATTEIQLPRGEGNFYAFVHVHSPRAREARLVATFADSLAAWWNGEEVLRVHRHPKWLLLREEWAERVPVEMAAGWNTLLLKVESSLMGPTRFQVRVADENGATLRDLTFARNADGTPHPDFDDHPEAPLRVPVESRTITLGSWTDGDLRHFAGTAIYEIPFRLPNVARSLWLDLGAVGVAAEVWVNQQPCGVRAWPPFRFDITRAARPGWNTLRVRVANSNAGWLAQGPLLYPKGSWGLDFETELDRLARVRPNGLEGPVRVYVSASAPTPGTSASEGE